MTVRFVAGPGLMEAIRIIKARKGITIPELAERMKCSQSTADNYLRRLHGDKLVTRSEGKPQDGAGRPAVVWTWAGKDVELVSVADVRSNQHQEAVERKHAQAGGRKALRARIHRVEAEAHLGIIKATKLELAKAETHQDKLHLEAVIRASQARVDVLTKRAEALEGEAKAAPKAKAAKPAKAKVAVKAKPAPKLVAKAKAAPKAKAPKAAKPAKVKAPKAVATEAAEPSHNLTGGAPVAPEATAAEVASA